MRRLSMITLALAGAASLSACASAYDGNSRYAGDPCRADRHNDKVAGTVVGAGAGALAGSAIAGNSSNTAGTVAGAVVGGIIGNKVAESNSHPCPGDYRYRR